MAHAIYALKRRFVAIEDALMRLHGVRGGGRAERLKAHLPVAGGSERKGTGESKAVMSIPGHWLEPAAAGEGKHWPP
jgi:hypothetical protein